jgi:hypothetical protein
LADLLVEFVLLGVGLLAHLLAAVAEDVRPPFSLPIKIDSAV